MYKNNEPSFLERARRFAVDVIAGEFCPLVRIGKWVGGWWSDDKIFFLLGDAGSGKTELFHLLSDSQYAPFFWGTQHHAEESTPGEEEDTVQIGCTYIVTNDGAGAEEDGAKHIRMGQMSRSLEKFLKGQIGCKSKTTISKMHYTIPVYAMFTYDISGREWDMEGLQAELRMFKEKVLGQKYFYVEENKSKKKGSCISTSVGEDECGKELKFSFKCLLIGTHLDCVPTGSRDAKSRLFDSEITNIMRKEFKGEANFRTITADIRSAEGRELFMDEFSKRMGEFHD